MFANTTDATEVREESLSYDVCCGRSWGSDVNNISAFQTRRA